MGPWLPWHPAEAFTPAVAPGLAVLGFSVPFLLLSIHRDKWQSLSLDRRSGSQSILSLFFPSLVSCLRLSHTRIPVSPWGARCLLLWSNLSAPALSVSVCVCVKYPTSRAFAGCQRAGGLGRAWWGGSCVPRSRDNSGFQRVIDPSAHKHREGRGSQGSVRRP